MKTIEVSGMVRPDSGIGVIQRNLYPLLSQHFDVIEARTRDRQGKYGRLIGFVEGLFAGRRDVDGHLCVVAPLPLVFSRPLVTIVHDLRWQREGSRPKKIYRKLDLARVVMQSDAIVCVSETTRQELIGLFPKAAETSVSAWLGPGIAEQDDCWREGTLGQLLLIGGARRKRNELAARVLSLLPPGLVTHVVGVGVSSDTQHLCEQALSAERCRWLSRISDDELMQEFQNSRFYVHLGIDEGFGLPFVEALRTGTIVVAIDQALTREVLGSSAILVPDGKPDEIAASWSSAPIPHESVRRERGRLFNWDTFAETIVHAIEPSRETHSS